MTPRERAADALHATHGGTADSVVDTVLDIVGYDALLAERDLWRQQYKRERVRVGYVLGWLSLDSFDDDESKQHEYIAHMDTAAGVRSRLDTLRDDLRSARAALQPDPAAGDGGTA